MLDSMKKSPIAMKPYEMHIVGGNIGAAPSISNVQIVKKDGDKYEYGGPVIFTCDMLFEVTPQVEFQLAAQKTGMGFSSFLLPDVTIDLHWVYFAAKLHIEVSMVQKVCKVYFVGTPDVKWDLDVEVSKLEIPLNVEDKVDVALEKALGAITEVSIHGGGELM